MKKYFGYLWFFFVLFLIGQKSMAQVVVNSGGDVIVAACNAFPSAAYSIANIELSETNATNFSIGNGKSFEIRLPNGFYFTGSPAANTKLNSSTDLNNIGVTIGTNTSVLQVLFNVTNSVTTDILVLSGLQVVASTASISGTVSYTAGANMPELNTTSLFSLSAATAAETINGGTAVADGATFCDTEINTYAASLTVNGGENKSVTINHQWYQSSINNSINFPTVLSGATDNGFVVNRNTQTSGTYFYLRETTYVSGGNVICTERSSAVSVTIVSVSPGIITASASAICLGENITLSEGVGQGAVSSETLLYKWQKHPDLLGTFTDVTTGTYTNSTLFLDSSTLTQTTTFRRLVKTTNCSSWKPSNVLVVYVNRFRTDATANIQFSNGTTATQYVCSEAQMRTFLDNSSSTPPGNITWQWFKEDFDGSVYKAPELLVNATSATYTPPRISTSVKYYRITYSNLNGAICEITSNKLEIVEGNTVNLGTIVFENTNPAYNISATEQLVVSGSLPSPIRSLTPASASGGGTGNISYSWRYYTDSDPTFRVPAGVYTATTYTPTVAITETTYFLRAATNTATSTITNASETCGVFDMSRAVIARVPIPGSFPAIVDSCAETSITLTPTPNPTPYSSYYTYQWQLSLDNSVFTNVSTNGNNPTYTTNTLTQSTYFRRVASITASDTLTVTPTATLLRISTLDPGTLSYSGGVLCYNTNPAVISGTSVIGGGIQYKWYNKTANTSWTPISNTNSQDYDPPSNLLETTYYRREVTANNGATGVCTTSTASLTITVNEQQLAGVLGPELVLNETDTLPVLSVSADADGLSGKTYQWFSASVGGNFVAIALATSATYTVTTLIETTRYKRAIYRTSNGKLCEVDSNIITLTLNKITAGSIGGTATICEGGNAPLLSLTAATVPSGAIRVYAWQSVTDTNSSSLNWSDIIFNNPDYTPTGVVTSTWYRRKASSILSGNTAVAYTSAIKVSVTLNPVINAAAIPASAVSLVSCFGGNDGAINIPSSATSNVSSYTWTKTGDTSFTANTLSITNLTSGTYILTAKNGSVCAATQSFIVSQPNELGLGLATNCTQTLTATSFGGVAPLTLALFNSLGTKVGSDIFLNANESHGFTGLTIGATYSVRLTDSSCSNTLSKTFTIPSPMALDASKITNTQPSCTNALDGSITIPSAAITGGLPQFNYAISSSTLTATITQTANGFFSGLAAGQYNISVTDAAGCTATATQTISAKSALQITSFAPATTQRLSCNGATDGSFTIAISSDPGASPVISWYKNNVKISGSGLSQFALGAGNYRVELTDGLAGQCKVTKEFTVTQPDPLVVTYSDPINPLCFTILGGSIAVAVTGGTGPYNYSIDSGAPASFGTASATAINYTIQNIAAGPHSIVITDANSCSVISLAVTIVVPIALAVTHNENTQLSPIKCNVAGSLSVSVTGGTAPYFYEWAGPGGYNRASINATAPEIFTSGSYFVKVTDANQCFKILSVAMPDTANIFSVTGRVNSAQCVTEESTNSSILLTLSSNIVAPYTISWEKYGPVTQTASATNTVFDWVTVDNSSGKINLTGLGYGEYRVTVQDANTSGCQTVIKSFAVKKSTLGIYETQLTASSCENPEARYSFKLNFTNALKYYLNGLEITPSSAVSSTFSLSNSNGKYTLSKLLEGSYTLRIVEQINNGVTTTQGCELFANFTIANYQTASYGGETNVTLDLCNNTATFPDPSLIIGGVPFEDTNGDLFYIYQWNGPNNLVTQGAVPIGVTAGTYELRITDAQNCTTDPITFNFTNNVSAVSVKETITPLGCGIDNADGAINITISGGKAPYAIVWDREIPATGTTSLTYEEIGRNLLAVNRLTAGRYRLRITSSIVACENTDAITFTKFYTLSPVETLQLLEGPFLSKSLCIGAPGTLQIKIFDRDSDAFTFYYNGTIVSAAPLGNDNYELTIEAPVDTAILGIINEAGCGISVPVVTGVGTPDFTYTATSLENTGLISANDDLTFTNTSEELYTKMRWDFGDGSDLLEITAENEATTDIEHRYKTPGTFQVSLRFYNVLGCYKEVSQEIRVGKGYLVIFPSAFTPNNDGINDIFEAKYTGITAFTFEIFDMWGNQLYVKTADSLPIPSGWGWNGKYPSRKNYSFKSFRYLFTATTHDGLQIKTSGEATLLR